MPHKEQKDRDRWYRQYCKTHKRVGIVFTLAEYQSLKEQASSVDLTPPALIKIRSLSGGKTVEEITLDQEQKELLKKLVLMFRGTANNLNQLAKKNNINFLNHRSTITPEELLNILHWVLGEIQKLESLVKNHFSQNHEQ